MSASSHRESEFMTLNGNQSLDQILESAIVVSWADLMHGTSAGLIHIEYGFAPDRECFFFGDFHGYIMHLCWATKCSIVTSVAHQIPGILAWHENRFPSVFAANNDNR
jgi:hypothetical protein